MVRFYGLEELCAMGDGVPAHQERIHLLLAYIVGDLAV
jgi:hypothetical protein